MNNSFNQTAYYVKPQPTVIPGLKMAYGAQAVKKTQPGPATESQGWLNRLKNTVFHMVTEEAETDRPIGIAQLSRNTFLAHSNASMRTIVQNNNPMQDYRFRFVTEPRQR
jgi:hypothetical protein